MIIMRAGKSYLSLAPFRPRRDLLLLRLLPLLFLFISIDILPAESFTRKECRHPRAPASQAETQWRIALDTQLKTHCELPIPDAVLGQF